MPKPDKASPLPVLVHMIEVQSREKRITSGEKPWTSERVEVKILASGGALGRRKRWYTVASEPVADVGGMISHGINVENFVNFADRVRAKKALNKRSRQRRRTKQ
jgi:hypothetical protein